ncbi:hypothetical protein KCV87_32285 [Actinosynnema pretiosum subsp. pretiosum]|uniref:Uncharacterized protein n=1 Tax=Actinosynnema pretiosum subsp. pretiosum TaxID=103721 RepID=A0AA45L620_9PSEU|nr:Phage protein [Actinosynnema pretiosum subsp. pretiosum]QUF03982.1 hypothetical protein KCV87_32285 [Actinosynnema pretiosum subsp. pretiosum]
MARSYANIVTAIWRDKDFRALTAAEQRVYFLLVTQPDISAAGALPLTVGRWASYAPDTTAAHVRTALEGLARGRFVLVDWDTEEVLVRSFVRHDNGWGNSKRRPVIMRAAGEIVSPVLVRALVVEFAALGLSTDALSDALSGEGGAAPGAGGVRPPVHPGAPLPTVPMPDTLFSQVDSLSGAVSDAAQDGASGSDGVVECLVSSEVPQPSTLVPRASGAAAATGGATKRKSGKGGTSTRATRLPADWAPTDAHHERAAQLGLNVAHQAELFRLHAETNDRRARQWNAAFTTWLIKAPEFDRSDRSGRAPRALPAVPGDREAVTEWLRGEYAAGRTRPIVERTGLHYARPDLPLDVTGREAAEAWAVGHARQWINDHHQLIIDRVITRAAS